MVARARGLRDQELNRSASLRIILKTISKIVERLAMLFKIAIDNGKERQRFEEKTTDVEVDERPRRAGPNRRKLREKFDHRGVNTLNIV